MFFRSLLLTIAIALGVGCEGPTLPIPPPAALTAPDADGFVTLSGTAPPDVLVGAFNETRGEGVLGLSDAEGQYELRLRAEAGDFISYFYFQPDGDRSGTVGTTVPNPLP
ncbi:MAG: hypothetical protein AAGH15_11400 [Myxococcota bacterium]